MIYHQSKTAEFDTATVKRAHYRTWPGAPHWGLLTVFHRGGLRWMHFLAGPAADAARDNLMAAGVAVE